MAPADRRTWTLYTVCIAAILALGFALLVPPFQFNDEHGHFVRAYQISRGEFIGHEGERIPSTLLALLQRYPEGSHKKFHARMALDDLTSKRPQSDVLEAPTDAPDKKYFLWAVRATRLYCPIIYLPASAGILSASALNMSFLGMQYAARIVNVLCFIAALWLALSLAPDFRLLITAVALMPMTLHQAAAISADELTIALSLVCLAMLLHARERAVSRRYMMAMLVAFLLLTLSKNSYWALPLLLLVPARDLGGSRRKAAYIVVVVVAASGAAMVWNWLSHDSLLLFRQVAASKGIDPAANALAVTKHPLSVLRSLTDTPFLHHVRVLINGFVGTFGWSKFGLAPWQRLAYVFLLLAVALLEPFHQVFTIRNRLLLAGVWIGALIGTYYVLFIVDGVYANGKYAFWSAGVQGRYLIPYCLVGLLVLKQSRINVRSGVLAPMVLIGCTCYAIASLVRVVGFYY